MIKFDTRKIINRHSNLPTNESSNFNWVGSLNRYRNSQLDGKAGYKERYKEGKKDSTPTMLEFILVCLCFQFEPATVSRSWVEWIISEQQSMWRKSHSHLPTETYHQSYTYKVSRAVKVKVKVCCFESGPSRCVSLGFRSMEYAITSFLYM